MGVRRQVEAVLGSSVRRAVRIWGGYAPSATFRLFLADGRRVVFKGFGASDAARLVKQGFTRDEVQRQDAVMHQVLANEERTYRDLGGLLVPWAPTFHGSFECGTWRVLLLEDVGPPQVPPWTDDLARVALTDYAAFHASTLGRTDLPDWLSRTKHHGFARQWHTLAEQGDGLAGLAALAGERAHEAGAWLDRHLSRLKAVAQRLEDVPLPHTVLHFDTRSDNLRIQPDGRLRLFDWPSVAYGPPEFDVAAFVQSIATEGGPHPEQCLAWYAERLPLRATAVEASIAGMAGYFADRAWKPPIPGLPRVRSIQRRQLRVSLAWCARRLDVEPPAWLEAVPD